MNHFKALFLVGGPGSGKDFLIHSTLSEFDLKEVSMERVFNAIIKETNIEELENFPSIIVNGNADNKDKIIVTKAILESMGYDTAMIYVYTTDEASRHRNDFRIARGAKTFSESVRKMKYDSSVTNIEDYINMYEGFVLYDNSNHFAAVNEEKQKEMTSWLIELSETIGGFLAKDLKNPAAIKWVSERVLEVGSADTARFAAILTPGQASNKVHSYKEAENKIDVGPKYTGKKNPRDGDKFNGGVASAGNPPGNSSRVVADEELKIIQSKKPNGGTYPKVVPMLDIASTGVGGTTYQDTGGGVSSGGGGQTESIKDRKLKIKPAVPPSDLLKFNAAGGGGDYVATGGIQEKKIRKIKGLEPVTPKQSGITYGSGITNAPSNFGTDAVGALTYKEETGKKKKLGTLPGAKVSAGLSPQDQGPSEMLTALIETPKTFDALRNKLSSTVYNFDEELKV
jgi:hypothetical protein